MRITSSSLSRRRSLGLSTLAALVLLGACGSESADREGTAADPSSAGSNPIATDPSDGGVDPVDTGGGAPADGGLGSCTVNVTGAVTTSWTSSGGYSAIGYGPWIPQTPGVTNPLGIVTDETFFILNCVGTGTSSINFGANVDQAIPMQPATYTLPPADNVFGGSDQPAPIGVLVGIDGTDTNWGLREPGTLTITKFDETGIAGTFTLPLTDVLANLSGESKGDLLVEGTFDYANPN